MSGTWQDYKGIEGYRKMIAELQATIHSSYPEYQGKIYVFDQSQNTLRESGRAAQYLGISLEELVRAVRENGISKFVKEGKEFPNAKLGGVAIKIKKSDGSFVFVALGRTTDRVPSLTPEGIKTLAWNTVHEIGHALFAFEYQSDDFGVLHEQLQILHKELNESKIIVNQKARANLTPTEQSKLQHFQQLYNIRLLELRRLQESWCEVFSRSLLVHNGAEKEFLDEAAATYDARRLMGFHTYSPSEEIAQFKKDYPDFLHMGKQRPELMGYALEGMRRAAELAHIVGKKHMNPTDLHSYEELGQAGSLANVHQQILSQMSSTDQIAYLRARQHIIRNAPQILSAAYYKGGDYTTATPQVTKLGVAAGRAILQMGAKDKEVLSLTIQADQLLATNLLAELFAIDDIGLSRPFGLNDEDVTKLVTQMRSGKIKDLSWAQGLADGKPIEEIAPQIRVLLGKPAKLPDRP